MFISKVRTDDSKLLQESSLTATQPRRAPNHIIQGTMSERLAQGSYMAIRGHPFMMPTLRGSGSGGRMWTGDGGQAPCGHPHRKLKFESTVLSSSHAKKLASFLPEFRLWMK